MPSGWPARASMRPSCPPPRMPSVVTAGASRTRVGIGRGPSPSARSRQRARGARAQPAGSSLGEDGRRRAAPALIAPGLADRQRADRDAGGHLHDRQQRVDARAAPCDSTGTPSTGRCVLAAHMPGRWAAPPAPAMITSSPRLGRPRAYSNSSPGVRWARDDARPRAARRAGRASRPRGASSPSRSASP